ncbi:MAG: hypothetical protein IJR60_04925 [Eubacterium sp.]|nr:hypothetical protein [Eubacterium sp.]
MEKIKLQKNTLPCVIAIIITVGIQAFEKIIEIATDPGQATGLICAMFYTLCVAVVYYLITKGTSSFMGILAALLALKMMPPKMNYLTSVTPDGSMLYFIVSKVAVVLFAVLVYRFYREQEQPRAIKPLPILIIIVAVPFFNEISAFANNYLLYKTGSMVMPYLAQYACYAAAVLVTLAVAYASGKESMRFAAYFEFCALGINTVRQIGKIAYYGASGQHISKSYFLWIVVLVALAVIAFVMLKRSEKAKPAEEPVAEAE